MAANAADNEANPFEGKIYESDYAYFENAVAVNHVVYRYMPETDSVLAECIDLNSTLKKPYDAHYRKKSFSGNRLRRLVDILRILIIWMQK